MRRMDLGSVLKWRVLAGSSEAKLLVESEAIGCLTSQGPSLHGEPHVEQRRQMSTFSF